jgi:hypothetical protein
MAGHRKGTSSRNRKVGLGKDWRRYGNGGCKADVRSRTALKSEATAWVAGELTRALVVRGSATDQA